MLVICYDGGDLAGGFYADAIGWKVAVTTWTSSSTHKITVFSFPGSSLQPLAVVMTHARMVDAVASRVGRWWSNSNVFK